MLLCLVRSFFGQEVKAASSSLAKYSMEGYATVQKVTGGGVLSESSSNYYKVSSTSISFKTSSTCTLTLVADSNSSKNILIDGTKYQFKNGILTVSLKSGTHTITKSDTMNLFYMKVV